MPYPTIPAIDYSYTGFQASQGNNSFPGTQLDNDMASLEVADTNILEFIKLFATSEGMIKIGARFENTVFSSGARSGPAASAIAALPTHMHTLTMDAVVDHSHSATTAVNNSIGAENRVRNIALLGCVKL